MPGKPFQSKLEPFTELIREWRRQRWSYPRIADALHKQHGITVASSTIFSFVKVRAKRRKTVALPEAQQPPVSPLDSSHPSKDFFVTTTNTKTHEIQPYKANLGF